jgi:hypothetical protein
MCLSVGFVQAVMNWFQFPIRLLRNRILIHTHKRSTVSRRFMRGLRSAKTSHKLKSHISNALTYREKGGCVQQRKI